MASFPKDHAVRYLAEGGYIRISLTGVPKLYNNERRFVRSLKLDSFKTLLADGYFKINAESGGAYIATQKAKDAVAT